MKNKVALPLKLVQLVKGQNVEDSEVRKFQTDFFFLHDTKQKTPFIHHLIMLLFEASKKHPKHNNLWHLIKTSNQPVQHPRNIWSHPLRRRIGLHPFHKSGHTKPSPRLLLLVPHRSSHVYMHPLHLLAHKLREREKPRKLSLLSFFTNYFISVTCYIFFNNTICFHLFQDESCGDGTSRTPTCVDHISTSRLHHLPIALF